MPSVPRLEAERRARAILAPDQAGVMPGGQEVRRARIGGRRDRRLGVEHVLHVQEEGELVVDLHRAVQIDVDERADVAEGFVLRRRTRVQIAVRAIERQALVFRHRLDAADVERRRRQRVIAEVQRVLPVAAPRRRAVARRQVVRAHRAGIMLHTRRGDEVVLDDVRRFDAAGELDPIAQRHGRRRREIDARGQRIVRVHIRHVDDEDTRQRVREQRIDRVGRVHRIALADPGHRGLRRGEAQPAHRLEDHAAGEAARDFRLEVGVACKAAAQIVVEVIGVAVRRARRRRAGAAVLQNEVTRRGRRHEARILAARTRFGEGRRAEALGIGATDRQFLDRRELDTDLRREMAEAFRIMVVATRHVQLDLVEDRRIGFKIGGRHGVRPERRGGRQAVGVQRGILVVVLQRLATHLPADGELERTARQVGEACGQRRIQRRLGRERRRHLVGRDRVAHRRAVLRRVDEIVRPRVDRLGEARDVDQAALRQLNLVACVHALDTPVVTAVAEIAVQACGGAVHLVLAIAAAGDVAEQIIDARRAVGRVVGERCRIGVVRIELAVRRGRAIGARRADVHRQDDAGVVRRDRRCAAERLRVADRRGRAVNADITAAVAASDIAFDVVGDANADAALQRVALLQRLNLAIQVDQVVLAAGALRRTGGDGERVARAIGQAQRVVARGQRGADLAGERVVEVGLADARDIGGRHVDGQRLVGRVIVQSADRGQVLRVVRESAAVVRNTAVALIFAVQVDVETLAVIIAIAQRSR
ncbi:hypothetical protein WR25_23845 [Diploscapter pachys]|uniref:Uncharacterized protein n=1 Tax=Diploscapter pachys TaxID=2018661 RepID=A0A2A2KA77_9BILA|nr:hypothetical protein WR25_23845 [Diploscapter pachys]